MNRDELLQLAERVERASGPDRELDCSIAVGVGAVDARTKPSGLQGFGYVDRNQWACSNVPPYTASLDAAMSLVPEGRFWRIDRDSAGHWARVSGILCGAATPALALCAASLKALASQEGGGVTADPEANIDRSPHA
jgi:hypothetical protein